MAFITFSPITTKRIGFFKANRRAYWSLIIFSCVFALTLCSNFIANDKPLFVYYKGQMYFPIAKFYPETQFGGEFETEADYRDPVVKELIQKDGWMVMPPIEYSYQTINYHLTDPAPTSPTFENWLGTDDQGRDVLTRLLYGLRISILFGLTLTLFSTILGVAAGGIQGYFGGIVDLAFQRFIEIWSGLPVLYLLIILGSLVEPTFMWLLGLMLVFSWMSLVAVVRAEFLRTRNLDFVKAARAMGLPTRHIIFKHILPNAMVAALTFVPFVLNGAITTLTSLDFLGFGLPPGSPSLGELLLQGKNNLDAPWLGMTAFLSVAILLSLLIFIGEGVRDAFDPRKIER